MDLFTGWPSSLSRERSQTVVAFAKERYSTSVVEHATARYFFELQEMRFEPMKLIYAEVDVLSTRFFAQLASE